MKLRLIVAALLIAAGFGVLHFVVGIGGVLEGEGQSNQPVVDQGSSNEVGSGIPIGTGAAAGQPSPRISSDGFLRLPGQPVRIENADGSYRTEHRVLVEGNSKTIGEDQLSLTDGRVEFFDVPEIGPKVLIGEIEFGTALVQIGRNAEGQAALLATARQLDLRRATVQSYGDQPIILRDVARLLVREENGLVTFSAPPIEEIPQPILVEFPQVDGPSGFIEGLGIAGYFPIEEGEEDLRLRIDEQPLVRFRGIRLSGRGSAQYDERSRDGAATLRLDGGVRVQSETEGQPWDLISESVTARLLRSDRAPAAIGALPMRLFLDGDVEARFGGETFHASTVDLVAGPAGDLLAITATAPIELISEERGIVTNTRGDLQLVVPRGILAPVFRAYGIAGSGLPSSMMGLLRIGGPSETRRGTATLVATDSISSPIRNPVSGTTPTSDSVDPGLETLSARIRGNAALRDQDIVVQSSRETRLRRDGGLLHLQLGPDPADSEHQFGISTAVDGEELRLSGHGLVAIDEIAVDDFEVRFESPTGDATLRSDRLRLRELTYGRATILDRQSLRFLDVAGSPSLSGSVEPEPGRTTEFECEHVLSEQGLVIHFEGGESGVTVHDRLGDLRGDDLWLYPFDGSLSAKLEGRPATAEIRVTGDEAGAVTQSFDLEAREIWTTSQLLPDRLATLHRVPRFFGSGLLSPWIRARGDVALDGTESTENGGRVVTARSQRLIARLDGRSALLLGEPATARLVEANGRDLEGRGPRIQVDLTDPAAPYLRLVPEADRLPFIDVLSEGSDPEFRRLRIECENGIALRGGRTEFDGEVVVRAVDDEGRPVRGGLDLHTPELDIDWDPETRRLRRLSAPRNAVLQLRDIVASAASLELFGSVDSVEPSYRLVLECSDEQPIRFERAGRSPIEADRVVVEFPDERVTIDRGRSVRR